MSEEETKRTQIAMLARFILSRLFVQAVNVRVLSLDFQTGRAVVYFDPSRADVALLAALAEGAS